MDEQAEKAEESEDRAEMAPENIKGDVVKLSPADVMGDSSKARERADAILKERDAVAKALADAEEALAQLKKFKAEASELEEGTKGLAGLKSRIDAEITLVERRIEDIKAIQKMGGALDDAVKKAMKGSKSSDSREAVLAKRAAEVAKAVEDAATFQLGVGSGDYPEQTGGKEYSSDTVRTHTRAVFDGESDLGHLTEFFGLNLNRISGALIKNDAPEKAMTFKDIFGDKVVERVVGTDEFMQLASFEGMAAGGKSSSSTNTDAQTHDYMGISGRLYCLAERCSVTNGKLGAGWYWAMPSGKEYARWAMGGSEYTEYTDYAGYGYWLAVPTEGDKAGMITNVFTFGIPATGTVGKVDSDGNLGNSATYTGDAIGISVKTDADGNAAESGEFTADVTLKAKFATNPTVSGTVMNFKGTTAPDVVDEDWEVTLEDAPLLVGRPTALNTSNFGLTTAEGDFQPDDVGDTEAQGRWHARAYGGTSETRPTGITGDFHAIFTNGRVVGGYATRKED